MNHRVAQLLLSVGPAALSGNHENSPNNTRVAVIVEPRPDFFYPWLVRWFMRLLGPTWNFHIFDGPRNRHMRADIGDPQKIRWTSLDIPSLNVTQYSRLLKRADFWQRLPEEHILIFQLDSLLLTRGIPERFLEYPMIGAPCGDAVINGGFSLRRKSAMLRVIAHRPQQPAEEPEDVYFTQGLRGSLPSVEEQLAFAVESWLPGRGTGHPVGFHGHYLPDAELCRLLEGSEFRKAPIVEVLLYAGEDEALVRRHLDAMKGVVSRFYVAEAAFSTTNRQTRELSFSPERYVASYPLEYLPLHQPPTAPIDSPWSREMYVRHQVSYHLRAAHSPGTVVVVTEVEDIPPIPAVERCQETVQIEFIYPLPAPPPFPLHSIEEYHDSPLIHRQLGGSSHPSPSEKTYLNQGTEYRAGAAEMAHMRDQPVVWVRLGVPHALAITRHSDADTFVQHILPQRTRPFVLITTDGDRNVPEEIRSSTVHTLLSHPLLLAWYSQNLTSSHPKLHPIPIGLRVHVPQLPQTCAEVIQTFQEIRNHQVPLEQRPLRIWSDCHLMTYPSRHGNPRAHWRDVMDAMKYVDPPDTRMPQATIWHRYSEYAFVVSLPGNGLDCHRTWEALYLGAIVITEPSALVSTLYHKYRVVELPREEWTRSLNDVQWLQEIRERYQNIPVYQETPAEWQRRVKRVFMNADTITEEK